MGGVAMIDKAVWACEGIAEFCCVFALWIMTGLAWASRCVSRKVEEMEGGQ